MIGEKIEKIDLKSLDNFSKYKQGRYTYKKYRIINNEKIFKIVKHFEKYFPKMGEGSVISSSF